MKPVIVVLSKDTDQSFHWASDGWYQIKHVGTPKAEKLMGKARKAINDGKTIKDVIARLKKAGFAIKRR